MLKRIPSEKKLGVKINLLKIDSILKVAFFFLLSCSDDVVSNGEEIQKDKVEPTLAEIFLLNNLDENRGYCLDIKGYKTNADPTRGLQAHTCYSYQGSIAIDQGFDIDKMNSGQFFLPGFEVCIELSTQNDKYEIKLSACDLSNNAQNLKLTDKGEITVANDPSLCLTASDKESREGGGGEPVHLIRDLSITSCDDQKKAYQRWGLRSSN